MSAIAITGSARLSGLKLAGAIAAGVTGLLAVVALIWFGGPFIGLGNDHPLATVAARSGLVGGTVVGTLLLVGRALWRRRQAVEGLTRGLTDGDKDADDTAVLTDKMKEALDTLKTSGKGRSATLYDLPWYVLIGPPASGKTTALLNSGLKFPLARGAAAPSVEGVGGTRYCDWLFAEEAVLIDTAGRYTTQDSDGKADRRSWLSFLDLLKRYRPKQPINGVVVAFSLADLMTMDARTLDGHAQAIRERLAELHARLKVDFPVYVLFTKADLVSGFAEYFGDLGEDARRQVWGATFQTADRRLNMVADVPKEFEALIERLNTGMADRLQDEPVPSSRVTLFGFPGQMAGLNRPVFDFLKLIFEPTRYRTNAILRGFYFTSGVQHGLPIDRLLMALVRNFNAAEVGAVEYSGVGKSFFLTDLLGKVILGEASWVSTDRGAVRRAMILRVAALSTIAVVAAACLGAWWLSSGRNRTLIDSTTQASRSYDKANAALIRQSLVADHKFETVLPVLDAMKAMPPFAPVPPWSGFGLSRYEDLNESAGQSYAVALERLLRPRLLFRLEAFLDTNTADPLAIYDALKVYMMLGGQHRPIDRKLVTSWIAADLAGLIPGAGTQEEARKRLMGHVEAMLDNDGIQQPLVEPSVLIQSDAQKALVRLTVAQRAYGSLKAGARANPQPDWIMAAHGGQDFSRVFAIAPDARGVDVRVPGFFTYAGFYRSLLARLPGIADQLRADDAWVLGDYGKQTTVVPSYDTLTPDVLALYRDEFDKVWQAALGRLQLKRLTADKPTYAVLDALAAKTTSPLIALIGSIHEETALTQARPGFAMAPATPAADGNGQPAPAVAPMAHAPGADIDADFTPYATLVAASGPNGTHPIDELMEALHGIQTSLPGPDGQAGPQTEQLFKQVSALRAAAARLPSPFRDMITKAAAEFDGDVSSAIRTQLARTLNETVIAPCRTLVQGAYPFEPNGRDMRIDDFARLFAPAPIGAFDSFFADNLKAIVDVRPTGWTMRPDSLPARALSPRTLQSFQHAAAVRDVFFPPRSATPTVSFSVKPSPLAMTGYTAKLEVNGTSIESKMGVPSVGGAVTWPGPNPDGGTAAVNLISDTAGQMPVGIDPKYGGWALMRLLEGARPTRDGLSKSFVLGTTELDYEFRNPRAPDLFRTVRSFSCPGGL